MLTNISGNWNCWQQGPYVNRCGVMAVDVMWCHIVSSEICKAKHATRMMDTMGVVSIVCQLKSLYQYGKEIILFLFDQLFLVFVELNQCRRICSRLFIYYYHSSKIFPRFWLVETTRIIHYSQLLLTKFGKNFVILSWWRQKFCHIKPMTSKVQPAADYWTVDRENLGTRLCYFWWAEKQREKWRNSF